MRILSVGLVRASDGSCNNAPRTLQGHLTAVSVLVVAVWSRVLGLWPDLGAPAADDSSPFTPHHR